MRRPALLLVCVLLLATGLALLGLAQTGMQPIQYGDSAADTANVAIGRAFYAAADEVLATGNVASLDAVVAPDLAEHPARPGAAGRDGLLRALLARRAAFLGLRLVVDDVQAAGSNLVVARVHAEGRATGSFLGRPIPATLAAWGPIELLRIDAGRVAERWGSAGDDARLEPLWNGTLRVGSHDVPRVVAVRRLTWEPEAELEVSGNPARWFLCVEAGELAVSAQADMAVAASHSPATGGDGVTAWDRIPANRTVTLAPTAVVAITPDVAFRVRNTAATRAVALLVALWMPGVGQQPFQTTSAGIPVPDQRAVDLGLNLRSAGEVALASGVTMQVLATAPDIPVPEVATLAVGRVTLATGTVLALPADDGTLVLAVDGGRLALAPSADIARAIGRDGRMHEIRGRATLAVGEGALVASGGAEVWSADAGAAATVLVVAVDPVPGSGRDTAVASET